MPALKRHFAASGECSGIGGSRMPEVRVQMPDRSQQRQIIFGFENLARLKKEVLKDYHFYVLVKACVCEV